MSDFVAGDKPILYEVVNNGLRYITTDKPDGTESSCAEYRRADLPPTLSAAMKLPEVKALVDAARPFYAAVFNDNGDVTISTGHITTGDWLALDAALAAIKEPKT